MTDAITMASDKAVSAADVQRLYLQAILSKRFLSAKLARILWSKCREAVSSEESNVSHLAAILHVS
jgi:hypothetical protein